MRLGYLIVLIWTALASVLWAKELEVSPTGDYRTIESAIAASGSGDTIVLHPGVYPESGLKVTHSLTLRGEGNPVIDGRLQGTILSVSADDVAIEGITFKNVGRSFTADHSAIYLSRCKRFRVCRNTLVNAFFGIHVEKCKSGVVAFNDISGEATSEAGAGNGVHLWHCSRVSIHHNRLHQLRDGIYLEFVDKSVISQNDSFDNLRYGLHFMFSNHDEYRRNRFENNGAGVAVMFSKFIRMSHNRFLNNWGASSYGLLLKEIYDAEVDGNLFDKNSVGIHADGSTRIQYRGNRFRQNGWAVKVAGACYGNNFSGNAFEHNTFDLSYSSQLNDNLFDGNFWSDYTGYDLDRNGTGDVPYRPVSLFSYIVGRTPESVVLLRSLFVDVINFSEKVSPVFTPDGLLDHTPLMKSTTGELT